HELHQLDKVVEAETLSQVIGRGGQNVRLASQLLDWKLNVISTQQAEDKNEGEIQDVVQLFKEKLDVDKEVAEILVDEGFDSMEAIAYAESEKLLTIKEFDEQLVEDLKSRASDALLAIAISDDDDTTDNVSNDLSKLDHVDEALLLKLVAHGITNREELAEQAVDDLLEIEGIDESKAADLIMEARIPWFQNT
ncbi:MAG: transcription termination/antitermination protein NusA, partial [Gammaproteobacteria bacterium]|nr:transcription termination/antitermination protein NusA [Gammaproteobacteria bacterium]